MHVLFLGREDSPLRRFLEEQEAEVTWTDQKFDESFILDNHFDFLVSYNYQHILRGSILRHFPDAAVNLHISLLPWNRGRDPNFWSFIDGTPKGVTIHYIDEGVDTGDIIVQKELEFSSTETLTTSYEKLQQEIQKLFFAHWESIRAKQCPRIKQAPGGSVHKSVDKNPLLHLLVNGWDTPVINLEQYRMKS